MKRFAGTLLILALSGAAVFFALTEIRVCQDPVFHGIASGFARRFGVEEIHTAQVLARLKDKKPTLFIDARQKAEQGVSILPGAVAVMPGTALPRVPEYRDFASQHAGDKDAMVVVYCAGGYRSAEIVAMGGGGEPGASERSGPTIRNLHGGIVAYVNEGGRVVHPQSGESVRVVHGYNSYWAKFVRAPYRAVTEPAP